jgi:hypothetical protein
MNVTRSHRYKRGRSLLFLGFGARTTFDAKAQYPQIDKSHLVSVAPSTLVRIFVNHQ